MPFVFVLDPQGPGLLLKVPKGGDWFDIVEITLETAAGVAALAFAFQGRLFRRNSTLETALFTFAGLMLIFPSVLDSVIGLFGAASLQTYIPGLPVIGIHMGYNVVIGALVLVSAILLQQARSGTANAT